MGPWMEGRVLRGLTMLIKEFYSSKSPFNILKCDAMLYQTSHISHILSAKWPKTSRIPPIFRKVKLPYFPYFFFMSRWAPCPQTNLIAYHRSDLHTYISEPTERTVTLWLIPTSRKGHFFDPEKWGILWRSTSKHEVPTFIKIGVKLWLIIVSSSLRWLE